MDELIATYLKGPDGVASGQFTRPLREPSSCSTHRAAQRRRSACSPGMSSRRADQPRRPIDPDRFVNVFGSDHEHRPEPLPSRKEGERKSRTEIVGADGRHRRYTADIACGRPRREGDRCRERPLHVEQLREHDLTPFCVAANTQQVLEPSSP